MRCASCWFWARWYSPEHCRFLSRDPIGLEGGLNLYVFCGNDPVNYRDPSGQIWLQVGGAVIGATVNAVKNYSAYKNCHMSGSDYAKSIFFGAGAGALSTIIPGASGVFAGGVLAGINDANNQSIDSRNDGINWKQSGNSAALGIAAGSVGYLGQSIGGYMGYIPDQIGKVVGSPSSMFQDFSDIGGLVGLTGGTILSEGIDSEKTVNPCSDK